MYHIIVNPASRSGKGNSIWNDLETVLREQNVAYAVHFTKKAGDAKEIAEKLTGVNQNRVSQKEVSQTEINKTGTAQINVTVPEKTQGTVTNIELMVMGGDGTLNEVLQGICDFAAVTVSYIPLGSSNDFARDYGHKGTPKERLLSVLRKEHAYRTDIGCVKFKEADGNYTTRYFAVSAGIGYDAAVCAEVNDSKLKPIFNRVGLGKVVYLAVALRQLIKAKDIPCRLSMKGKEEILMKRFLVCACMNHRFEGGGFMFAPEADAEDGLLDLCVVAQISKLKILRVLPTAFKGKHVRYKEVHMYRSEEIRIVTDEPMYVHVDGEVPGKTTELLLSCQKQALKLYL